MITFSHDFILQSDWHCLWQAPEIASFAADVAKCTPPSFCLEE
jgi:hypothetical protein